MGGKLAVHMHHQDEPRQPHRHYTRIICISDTHNTQPSLPKGDILIHAGDLTNQGSHSELRRTFDWLRGIKGFKLKIVVAGNHDVRLDRGFWKEYGGYFSRGEEQMVRESDDDGDDGGDDDSDGVRARALYIPADSSSAGICYLEHEARTFEIPTNAADGTMTRLKVFGSPYSPSRGLWAFGYAAEDGAERWADVPLDADVVIAHTPPKFHCDESPSRGGGAAGCEDLRQALWRVRPRLVVCGHVHEARGVESVLWDLEAPNVRYKESETFYWDDETVGSKKQFRVDLTSRSVRPLRNDGARGERESTSSGLAHSRGREISPEEEQAEKQEAKYGKDAVGPTVIGPWQHDGPSPTHQASPSERQPPFPQSDLAERPIPPTARPRRVGPAIHGVGGLPLTGRCDVEALAGRRGRRETCIVNAAVTGSSWPHRSGKKINKPIVIDLELPMVRSGST